MRAVFKRLFGLHGRRPHETSGSGPEGHRAFPGKLRLEALEDRTSPTVSVLGIPVPDLPSAESFGLSSMPQAPVTIDARLPPQIAPVFGDQLGASFDMPLPDFLSPSGTATVATPTTGAWTVTNFTVNNARLDQQADSFGLSDASRLWSLVPDPASSTATSDVVHMDLEPFGLELQGIRVEASQVGLNASFAHPPGLFETQWAAVMSAVERVLGLFAAALDTAARAVGRAALAIHLPPALIHFFDNLYPPGTVHVLGWSYGPLDFREPGVSVSVPTLRVDVYADTGPGKTLGNMLAALTRVIVEGGEVPGLPDGPGPFVPKPPRGPGGFGPNMPPGAGGGLVDPMSAPQSGSNSGSSSGGKSDATPGGGPIVWIVIPVKLSAAAQKPFAAVVMSSGAPSNPSLLVERIEPVLRPDAVEPRDDHSLFDDDVPLALVLPDIALPEEDLRRTPWLVSDVETSEAAGQEFGGGGRRDIVVLLRLLQAAVALIGEDLTHLDLGHLLCRLDVPTNEGTSPVPEPMDHSGPIAGADPQHHAREGDGIAGAFLLLTALPQVASRGRTVEAPVCQDVERKVLRVVRLHRPGGSRVDGDEPLQE